VCKRQLRKYFNWAANAGLYGSRIEVALLRGEGFSSAPRPVSAYTTVVRLGLGARKIRGSTYLRCEKSVDAFNDRLVCSGFGGIIGKILNQVITI